jgi:hypothetical protein
VIELHLTPGPGVGGFDLSESDAFGQIGTMLREFVAPCHCAPVRIARCGLGCLALVAVASSGTKRSTTGQSSVGLAVAFLRRLAALFVRLDLGDESSGLPLFLDDEGRGRGRL